MDNVTLPVVAMRVGNPDCAAFTIKDGHTAPTPSGFAEIISDDFPVAFSNRTKVQHALAGNEAILQRRLARNHI